MTGHSGHERETGRRKETSNWTWSQTSKSHKMERDSWEPAWAPAVESSPEDRIGPQLLCRLGPPWASYLHPFGLHPFGLRSVAFGCTPFSPTPLWRALFWPTLFGLHHFGLHHFGLHHFGVHSFGLHSSAYTTLAYTTLAYTTLACTLLAYSFGPGPSIKAWTSPSRDRPRG